MSERVSDLEVIKQFARMNTGIANMIACDLLDSRARVKELEIELRSRLLDSRAGVKELEGVLIGSRRGAESPIGGPK